MSLEAIQALMERLDQPRYRAGQIYRWVFQRGARNLEEMTDLPKRLRADLAEQGYSIGRVELGRVAESVDGTRKLSIRLDDGAAVETVLIPMGENQFTQCLSSQVGCALDCKFCFTGTMGLSRHLTAGEIVDQVILGRTVLPEEARISHLVYMGMGEPLHNFDAVVSSLTPICDQDGLGYSHRRVTISTSGLIPQIERLGKAVPVNLAISLNASNDEIRDAIMPINKRYNLSKLMATLREYPLPPRRKMTMEYVLLGGVNDSADHARELARLLKGLSVRINLIPWNPFGGPGYERPTEENVRAFQDILLRKRYTVTVRVTKGLDIDAACGQLGDRPDPLVQVTGGDE
jgi:23S rRNA (adenine2503-C2)-methyltransferase